MWCTSDMSADELRELMGRHARPDLTTAIDGVRICKADHTAAPESSMSGTVLAVVAQGAKRLALGDRFYDYGAGVLSLINRPCLTESGPLLPRSQLIRVTEHAAWPTEHLSGH